MKQLTKSFSLILVLCFAWTLLLPITAFADTGPKPSVTVEFLEAPKGAYVTLLSKESSTGPWSAGNSYLSEETAESKKAFAAFSAYQDPDGYYFLSYYDKCREDGSFRWNYYPPSSFKILLYDPQSESFVCSGILRRYAFDSRYQVQRLSQEGMEVRKSYDYARALWSAAFRCLLTILIELAAAFFFGYRSRRHFKAILLANLATQLLLNLLLLFVEYRSGVFITFFFSYFAGELLVFLLEASLYCRLFPQYGGKKGHPAAYAFTANALSLLTGLWLSNLLPALF